MEFRSVTLDEGLLAADAVAEQEKVVRRATSLIEALGKQFNDQHTAGVSGLAFATGGDYPVVGMVKSPFGNGRITLGWRLEGRELVGVLTLAREQIDHLGRNVWEPVLAGGLPSNGGRRGGLEVTEDKQGMIRNQVDLDVALGLAMLYAILNGPVVTG